MLSRGDTVLVLESGRFARGWGEMAKMMGVEVEVLRGDWRRAVDPAAVEERLKRDKGHTIKAMLVVQIDTASGVVNDIPAIRKAMDAAKHPALLMVDCVASLGCMPFDMDGWGVDVAMSGSQKGLMTPPGLAFVAANERARAVHKTAGLRTLYWDWTFREGEIHYQKYCGTPPEHLLFGLRKAIDMLKEEGLDARHPPPRAAGRGDAGRRGQVGRGPGAGLQHCQPGRAGQLHHLHPHAGARSASRCSTTAATSAAWSSASASASSATRPSASPTWATANAPMVLGTLGAVEMGLKALGHPARVRRRAGRGGVPGPRGGALSGLFRRSGTFALKRTDVPERDFAIAQGLDPRV